MSAPLDKFWEPITDDDRSAQWEDFAPLSRYEELTRKCYSLVHAAAICAETGQHRMSWIWGRKMMELFNIRDALTLEQASRPAKMPNMGKYALS